MLLVFCKKLQSRLVFMLLIPWYLQETSTRTMHRLISPGGRKEEMQCLMPLDQEMKSERVWIEKHQGGWERKDPIIAKMICHRMSNADGRTWQMINTAARVIV